MTKDSKSKKRDKNKSERDEFLFQIKTVIDEKEFKRFQKFFLNKFKNTFIPKLIIFLLAVIALYLNISKGNMGIVILIIVFLILYPTIFIISINLQIKKMYRSNKRINMLEEVITFYDDHLESKSIHNYCKVDYKDLYKTCETKTNIYIFISDNQAFILTKKNISKLDKFIEFIKSKGNYKRYY